MFSGIGGFDLAAKWVGWNNAFHCEINPFGQRILKYHFPNSVSYEDITKTDFRKWRGQIDVLSGGFPCQPFSLAGSRKGADDDRYLWPEMLRAIREIRPYWVVGENVGGIITMVQPGETVELGCETSLFGEDYKNEELHQQYVVETICSDLEREGYSVQPMLIPACAVGAPHRRDRVWFIANRTDTGFEMVQCRRKDRISTAGAAANSDSYGCRERTHKQKSDQRGSGETDHCGTSQNGASTNTNGKCLQRRNNIASQEWESKDRRKDRQLRNIPDWRMFPTQSPVCSRNDGLSTRLDGITFPRWREESVKAYGNAIVPQVAYEIFNDIKRLEMENSTEKRTCADCKYYEECVKGAFGNIPADACDFSDVIHYDAEKEA